MESITRFRSSSVRPLISTEMWVQLNIFYNRLVGKDFIKRIIATPGDKLGVHDTKITVNGEELKTQLENPNYLHWEQYACERGFFECSKLWTPLNWPLTTSATACK